MACFWFFFIKEISQCVNAFFLRMKVAMRLLRCLFFFFRPKAVATSENNASANSHWFYAVKWFFLLHKGTQIFIQNKKCLEDESSLLIPRINPFS